MSFSTVTVNTLSDAMYFHTNRMSFIDIPLLCDSAFWSISVLEYLIAIYSSFWSPIEFN